MNTQIQEQMPAWHFARYRKPLQMRQVDQAYNWVHRALRQVRRDAEREFQGRGFQIHYRELSFGGVRMRARLNLRKKELFIDPESEADLFQAMHSLGLPSKASPKELILSHELFHLFCSRCPTDIAELAAHLFCAELLQLSYFPGLLDCPGLARQDSQAS